VNPVVASEIKSLPDYEITRPDFRRRVLDTKKPRRIAVGNDVTLLFENHDTVLYQIQEMLRVERIRDPHAIKHEIDTYNELVGGKDELCASLLIEYPDEKERDQRLQELVGLEKHVALEVKGAGTCRAVFDERQMSPERISSVHYVHFPLGSERADAIRAGAPVAIVIDHPKLSARAALTREQCAALAEDLSA